MNLQLWERRSNEGDPEWRAFYAYLLAPDPRSLVQTAVDVRRPVPIVQEWAHIWGWDRRARAYDDAGGPRLEPAETDIDIVRRHRRITSSLLELAELELHKFIEEAKTSPATGAISIGELTKLIETTIKLDRLIDGKSTENLRIMPQFDLTSLSPHELLQWEALASKALSRGR